MTDFVQTDFGQNRCFSRLAQPRRTSRRAVGTRRGGAKISLFFLITCHNFLFSFPSLGGLLVDFGGVRRDPQMCTFGVLGLSCDEALAGQSRRKIVAGEGKKKREILGGPAEVGRRRSVRNGARRVGPRKVEPRKVGLRCKDDTSKDPFSRCETCKNLVFSMS